MSSYDEQLQSEIKELGIEILGSEQRRARQLRRERWRNYKQQQKLYKDAPCTVKSIVECLLRLGEATAKESVRQKIMGYGTVWLKKALKIEASEFGSEVAEFCNVLADGIYHLDGSQLKKADWSNERYIELSFSNSAKFATYDFDWLTRLVVLSHDRCIRVEINASSPRTLKLIFHKRERGGDSIYNRMPTLEGHIEQLRPRLTDWINE